MGEISVKTGNNARNGGKNSLNRLIRCVCGKKIGPDPRNFNQRVSLGRNDLLIRTFLNNNIVGMGRKTKNETEKKGNTLHADLRIKIQAADIAALLLLLTAPSRGSFIF
ncbi:hypothetical protein AAHX51_26510 (plasmid) [Klebsiella pneumoniae]